MRKQVIKQLYTTYTVKGSFEELKNSTEHKLSSYSSGKGECIKIHKSLKDWLNTITNSKYKVGFGIRGITQDGETLIIPQCNYYCATPNYTSNDYISRIAKCISYYLDDNSLYYYDIEYNSVLLLEEYTGHTDYNSRHKPCDNCKTCGNVNCDNCVKLYIVRDFSSEDNIYYKGTDITKATKVKNKHEKKYYDIIQNVLSNYNVDLNWYMANIPSGNYNNTIKLLEKLNIPYHVTNM